MKRERAGAELLAEVVRSTYLNRQTGVVEVDGLLPAESLYFREGELYFGPRHPMASQFKSLLANIEADQLTSNPQILALLSAFVEGLNEHPRGRFRKDQDRPPGLVGPLPTVWLVMQLAVIHCDEDMLVARLGGEEARYRTAGNSPALQQLPGLDIELTQLLTRLEHPTTPSQLTQGVEVNRLRLLQDLARLRAIGLAEAVDDQKQDDDILSPEILQRLSERVGESLESEPLGIEIDQHLKRLGELLANLRNYDHYELLRVGHTADEDAIYAAYNELARQVHPSHAIKLGLKGREEALRVLFEWATEAYLTLSHPTRRFRYNMMMGIRAEVEVDAEQRQEEKRSIALQNYRRAAFALSEMDYSLAIDLLKEAIRLDPQPEYYARLAQAQAKNPHWHRHALANFKLSIESNPNDAGFRVGYAEFLEKTGRLDQARAQYKAALDLMPDHPTALTNLERLGSGNRASAGKSSLGSSLRNLFGGSDS